MKKTTLQEQRKLYKSYKKSRLNEANLLISLLNTGSYSKPKDTDIIDDAKADILNFASTFETILIKEVEEDLKTIS